jgi:hypothetical protein
MKFILNTVLKSKPNGKGYPTYPLYIVFSVNRQTYKIKPRIADIRLTYLEFTSLLPKDVHPKNHLIQEERRIMEYLIEKYRKIHPFNLKQLLGEYKGLVEMASIGEFINEVNAGVDKINTLIDERKNHPLFKEDDSTILKQIEDLKTITK